VEWPGPPPTPRMDELDSGDEGRARARAPGRRFRLWEWGRRSLRSPRRRLLLPARVVKVAQVGGQGRRCCDASERDPTLSPMCLPS